MTAWKPFHLDGMDFLEYETPEWMAWTALSSGGNLVRLRHCPSGAEILRFPRNPAELEAHPECFGTPLLLPPNRIAGGCFLANGTLCRLPVNEPSTDSHLHGIVLGRPWNLLSTGEHEIAVFFQFGPGAPEYCGFPYRFRLEMRCRFEPDFVTHLLSVRNTGSEPMPLGVGFHTAFYLPSGENARIEVPRGEGVWEVHPRRRLPTGRLLPGENGIMDLLDGNRTADSLPVAVHFPVHGRHEAVIRRKNFRIRYSFDEKYRHLACWNDGGGKGFFCIEPMSWMTNAPNLGLPPAITGFSFLGAGETRIFHSEFRIES